MIMAKTFVEYLIEQATGPAHFKVKDNFGNHSVVYIHHPGKVTFHDPETGEIRKTVIGSNFTKDTVPHHVFGKDYQIVEGTAPGADGPKNTHASDVMETTTAGALVHLSGIQDSHKEHLKQWEATHNAAAAHMHPDDVKLRQQHGHIAAHSIIEHFKSKGYHGLKAVHVTNKNGDIHKATNGTHSDSAVENPSDLTLEFHHHPKGSSPYAGASLKSGLSGTPGFKNLGPKHLDDALGTKVEEKYKKHSEDFGHSHGIGHLTNDAKKEHMKANPGVEQSAREHGQKAFSEIRDHVHAKMTEHLKTDEGQEKVKKFLRDKFLNTEKGSGMPYVKTVAKGSKIDRVQAHTEEPTENEAAKALRHPLTKISAEKRGGAYIKMTAHTHDGRQIHLGHMQMKSNSTFGRSSMKIVGQA
jgi:hypothetical protein